MSYIGPIHTAYAVHIDIYGYICLCVSGGWGGSLGPIPHPPL